MSTDETPGEGHDGVERRTVIKGIGVAGTAAAVGGFGLLSTGSAVAGDTELENQGGTVEFETDDGEIYWVGYGGRLRYTWDGLDSNAEYGEYEVQARVHNRNTGNWTNWVSFGSQSGPLGDGDGGEFTEGEGNSADTWGGENDSNSGPGTDGFFQFKFGSPWGQRDYAIAYDDPDDVDEEDAIRVGEIDGVEAFSAERFEADEDGGRKESVVEIRKTCRVLDGNEDQIGVEDSDTARFEVHVDNREATGTTGGEVNGNGAADES